MRLCLALRLLYLARVPLQITAFYHHGEASSREGEAVPLPLFHFSALWAWGDRQGVGVECASFAVIKYPDQKREKGVCSLLEFPGYSL